MMGKTHKVGGVFVGVVASDMFLQQNTLISLTTVVVLITGSILGSLLPDIDKKESTIGRKLWFISWPIYLLRGMMKLLSLLSPAICLPLYKRIIKTMGHRYLAHSLFSWIVLTTYLFVIQYSSRCGMIHRLSRYINLDPVMVELINKSILASIIGVSIGMLSHILLDMYTKDGVAIWMPVSDKKVRFPFAMKTNGLRETLFRMILYIGIGVVGYMLYIPYILRYIG